MQANKDPTYKDLESRSCDHGQDRVISCKEDLDIITSVLLNIGLFGPKEDSDNAMDRVRHIRY